MFRIIIEHCFPRKYVIVTGLYAYYCGCSTTKATG